jgi:UDP-GlcNAc:undecaprenyl-phosphate GlcNAc-1-phosphate transferase
MNAVAAFLLPVGVAFAAALPLRRLALRLGLLDHPGPRKLQSRPVPYLGGVAVGLGIAAGVLLQPGRARLLLPVAAILAVGLVDDVAGLRPGRKLVLQVACAVLAVALGSSWALTHVALVDGAISVAWLVALANAFNLLDNMDGLCATVAGVTALGLAALVPAARPLAIPLAGAVAGFLVLNRPPARMYLGDAGSLAIGLAIGCAGLLAAAAQPGPGGLWILGLPVAVALGDTSLVVVSRLLAGRPIQVGGRDHFSHRLRLLGWSERQVLAATAAAAIAGPLMAWMATRFPEPVAWLAALPAAGLAIAWLLLLRLDPYGGARPPAAEVAGAG